MARPWTRVRIRHENHPRIIQKNRPRVTLFSNSLRILSRYLKRWKKKKRILKNLDSPLDHPFGFDRIGVVLKCFCCCIIMQQSCFVLKHYVCQLTISDITDAEIMVVNTVAVAIQKGLVPPATFPSSSSLRVSCCAAANSLSSAGSASYPSSAAASAITPNGSSFPALCAFALIASLNFAASASSF